MLLKGCHPYASQSVVP